MAVGSALVISPSAFASPSITVTAPGIQSFSSWPGSWFVLNQPDEFTVTPYPVATTATSTPQSTNTGYWTQKQVDTRIAHTTQSWVNTSHYVSYQYWVTSGHEATGQRWVTSGHWQSTQYWVNTSHYVSYQYWVNTSHYVSYQYWVNSSHYVSYQYWVNSGYFVYSRHRIITSWHVSTYKQSWRCTYHFWARRSYWMCPNWGWGPTYRYWVTSGHYATGRHWVTSGHYATGRRWVNTSHNVSYQYYDNTSHYATGRRWVTSGYYQTTTTYTTLVTYEAVWVPTVTTVSDQGLKVTSSKLLGVLPGIRDVTSGSPFDGQTYWANDSSTDGGFCNGAEKPLISPSSPAFPDHSTHLFKYTQYFESLGICTFNPDFIQGSNIQAWQINQDVAAMLLRPSWAVTLTYTQVTSVNGSVTSSVPKTKTEDVNGPVMQGPWWTIYWYQGVSCTMVNGHLQCPLGTAENPYPTNNG
jgi:hypothetical protein